MLNGKVAVITGGSRGIGKAIAMKLASCGAKIALIYAGNSEKAEEACTEIQALGAEVFCFKCDVKDFNATKQTVKDIKEKFGNIDILINNAGITKDGLILSMKEDNFDSVIDTNLKGAFNMIKHTSNIMLKKRSGKIINISSIAGIIGNAGQANYSASKAGLIGLTKSVAREFASRNICCNAVAPGFIETDMTKLIDDQNPLLKQIPLGHMGKPEDVAELVAFLSSDSARYITGEVIKVDGGLAI
ncbi:3-oxoacyl-[acyl-carrier-protein] reductase [Sedimentibacter sp. zth1]|uniref:3-oxoacyl-[acyl-carrier-protein] reductase n=1 Tax=Sedimentibacter sp. zth1 TaxID=2816908 RepID=UPI001A933E0A|nr:3-oxoacyl-[acyl-carrier-protein] reductase [Sedimentibacter sp. zth1]QSX05546.1 3-oxoacyl-[acyl-carrier-protein] reductase [Sedimentibacter sp. zth1]